MRRACLILGVLVAGDAHAGWRSALYPADWTPAHRDASGRFLHDFSHAGYRGGEAPLPDDPPGPVLDVTSAPYGADASGTADATAAIQRAIDDAGAAGGGVVYLPAGTYRISPPAGAEHALYIGSSGVVLRGAGAASSFLFNDATDMRGKRIIQVRPQATSHFSWYWGATDERPLAADAATASQVLAVSDTSGYAAGEWIVVRSDPTPAFIADHGMTGTWTADVGGPIFYRRIAAVTASTIALDVPIRYPLLRRDGARIGRIMPHLTEVGIEHLSIGNRQHAGGGTGDDDYAVPGTAAYEMHTSWAIYFTHVVDGWIRDVRSYRPAVNGADVHLLSNGIRLDASRFVTVSSVDLRKPQYRGEGGNGYLIGLAGSECLVRDSYLERGRHNLSFGLMQTSGNVALRVTARDGRLPVDFHMWLSMANLLDNVTVDGDSIEAGFRDCCGHGHATTQSVVWRTHGLRYPAGQWLLKFVVDSAQFGTGYVIGTRGAATQVRTSSADGTGPGDFVEGVGQGDDLEPVSLYEDQLARRTGTEPGGGADAGPSESADAGADAGASGAGPDAGAGPGGGAPPVAGCAAGRAPGPGASLLVLLLAAAVLPRSRRW